MIREQSTGGALRRPASCGRRGCMRRRAVPFGDAPASTQVWSSGGATVRMFSPADPKEHDGGRTVRLSALSWDVRRTPVYRKLPPPTFYHGFKLQVGETRPRHGVCRLSGRLAGRWARADERPHEGRCRGAVPIAVDGSSGRSGRPGFGGRRPGPTWWWRGLRRVTCGGLRSLNRFPNPSTFAL